MTTSEAPLAVRTEQSGDARQNVRFETLVPLRWGDMDARQHLNNTLYFRLMEEGRIQAFNRIGMRDLGDQGLILASIACDFVRPLTYPACARVVHTVERVGRASLEFSVEIEREDEPGVPYARGREVLVWVDYTSGKSTPWPLELRRHLTAE